MSERATLLQASERVPLWQAGALSTVLVGSWVAVSLAKGDYLNREASFPFLLGLDFSHLFEALWRSVSTWVSHLSNLLLKSQCRSAAPVEPCAAHTGVKDGLAVHLTRCFVGPGALHAHSACSVRLTRVA